MLFKIYVAGYLITSGILLLANLAAGHPTFLLVHKLVGDELYAITTIFLANRFR